ncbi:MAG: GNAT family N-acetyltransferase, partial [Anaerolineales bacterium]
MAQIRISQLEGDEMLKVMYPLNAYAFRPSPPLFDREDWMNAVRGRKGVMYFALFENDNPVAGVASSSMTQMVRGKSFPMGGIWGVATHPGSRRKGYSRQLMSELLAALREAGIPLSGLYPFRESFYERLGYIAFPQSLKARFPTAALDSLVKRDLKGDVEIQPIAEAFDIYQEYLGMIQKHIHGMAMFNF